VGGATGDGDSGGDDGGGEDAGWSHGDLSLRSTTRWVQSIILAGAGHGTASVARHDNAETASTRPQSTTRTTTLL
jgi:hypothetical protein